MKNRFLGLIEDSLKAHWELPALTDYQGETFYYKDIAAEIYQLHILLEQAGIRKGDRVALIGRNSSRWVISFFGILSYGAVATPILHDFKPENVHHIVNHSEAKVLLAAKQNWEVLNEHAIAGVELILSLEDWSVIRSKRPEVMKVREQIKEIFSRQHPAFSADEIRFHVEEPEEMAVLNYTSGTTGFSKGVMLPYRSLWSNTKYAADNLPFVRSGDHFVCMLPMAHMYGLAFEILNGINKGCHIHFLPRIPSPKIIIDSFSAVKPRLIIAVPLIIEKIVRNKIFPVLEQPKMKFLCKLPIVKQMIRRKILAQLNAAFGGEFTEVVIGGAAINKEVEAFLRLIEFRYTVGYGMTECGPLISYEQWDTYKEGSVGRIVDRMEVKIDSPDPENVAGEIMVRGTNVMLGYYKNPTATSEVMAADGWMLTGDLGTMDKEGFLFICGRSKTMILSSNGQNIYPEEIESVLNNLPYVGESLIVSYGDKLVALIYPDNESVTKNGLTDEDLDTVMKENLTTLNERIPKYCKIEEFRLRTEAFEKTPKQSIKRYLYQEK